MTGFGSARRATESHELTCDIRSVNGRSLDIKLRLPPGLEPLEAAMRKQVAAKVARGNLQLSVTAERAATGIAATVDPEAFRAIARQATALAEEAGVAPPTADGILSVRGVVAASDAAVTLDPALAPEITALVDEALVQLVAARQAEGTALGNTISDQIAAIETLTRAAAADPASQPEAIKERLDAQTEKLLSDRREGTLNPQRLEAEAALLATRADITEEIDRLHAHVQAARDLLTAAGAVGRKLDFLAQEFNREANTLCSKSASTELTRIGLELKSIIDRMREQVQNLQ